LFLEKRCPLPFPYRSAQDPFNVLPLFHSHVLPAVWDRYHQWLRSAVAMDVTHVLVHFGTNRVTIGDALTLALEEWLTDNILHFFTNSMKSTFKIKSSAVVFFSSYFLTLLFNKGHADKSLEDTFSYYNVKTWLSKK
jgi:Ulp1 family protease